MDAGVPHPNQSAYRKSVSCADAIFATQEVLNRYLLEGGKVHMCLYDLEKAFDSVEFPVVLRRLFNVGVNSKTWRILRSWYTDGQSSVHLGQHLSSPFPLGRGVRQGSILSPALFLLVMDPLLRQLQSLSMGASVNNMYAGGFLHADDIRTLASTLSTLEAQISTVKKFTEDNFSIVETCILPILLYGVENWVLSPESIRMLESFQGEIAKRILQLPKWYSNTAAIVALGQNSLHSVCTIRKLRFLNRVMTNEQSICHRAFSAMVDDVESLSLVRECRDLEERYKTNFTSAILSAIDQDGLDIIRTAQKSINKIDQSLLLQKIFKYPSLHKIAECIGWKKLWDNALNHGLPAIKSTKNLVRVITYPEHSSRKCPLCDTENLEEPTLVEHVITYHTKSDTPWSSLLETLCAMDHHCFSHVLCLLHIF